MAEDNDYALYMPAHALSCLPSPRRLTLSVWAGFLLALTLASLASSAPYFSGRLHLLPGSHTPSLAALLPGDLRQGEVSLSSASATAVQLRFSTQVSGSRALLAQLLLTVRREDSGLLIYRGPLALVGERAAGLLKPREVARFQISVFFPADAANSLQSQAAAASFSWRSLPAFR